MSRMFIKFFHFFLFSSLYISLCAVLMVYQTNSLFFNGNSSIHLMAFVFFSTICSYNFHWYLTPESVNSSIRSQWTQDHKGLHLVLTMMGLVGAIYYFFVLREHWMALCFSGFVTFLYSAPKLPQTFFKELKNVAIGKTIFLAFVWMFVTTMLPIFTATDQLKLVHVLFACSRSFLIYAICILFDYRDREDDKNQGIRSLITYFNERGVNIIFWISLIIFALSTLLLYWFHFSIATIIILLIPGIILAFIYNYSKKHFSDYLYYFLLDGLMMLSGLLMIIFQI